MEPFLRESPWLTFFAFWIAVWGVVTIIGLPFRLWNRVLRSRNIRERGWPPEHLDGDGDFRPLPKDDAE